MHCIFVISLDVFKEVIVSKRILFVNLHIEILERSSSVELPFNFAQKVANIYLKLTLAKLLQHRVNLVVSEPFKSICNSISQVLLAHLVQLRRFESSFQFTKRHHADLYFLGEFTPNISTDAHYLHLLKANQFLQFDQINRIF